MWLLLLAGFSCEVWRAAFRLDMARVAGFGRRIVRRLLALLKLVLLGQGLVTVLK